MAELSRKYGERLVVMAFPCNQFGHQENLTEVEILPSLKHVRPGGGECAIIAAWRCCCCCCCRRRLRRRLRLYLRLCAVLNRCSTGFEPNFPMFGKVEVNGERAHPVFEFLKRHLPAPYDDPDSLMGDPKLIVWSPVRRSDVSWNFEKFLIAPDGKPFRRYAARQRRVRPRGVRACMLTRPALARYSRRFPTLDIAADIEELMRALRL